MPVSQSSPVFPAKQYPQSRWSQSTFTSFSVNDPSKSTHAVPPVEHVPEIGSILMLHVSMIVGHSLQEPHELLATQTHPPRTSHTGVPPEQWALASHPSPASSIPFPQPPPAWHDPPTHVCPAPHVSPLQSVSAQSIGPSQSLSNESLQVISFASPPGHTHAPLEHCLPFAPQPVPFGQPATSAQSTKRSQSLSMRSVHTSGMPGGTQPLGVVHPSMFIPLQTSAPPSQSWLNTQGFPDTEQRLPSSQSSPGSS